MDSSTIKTLLQAQEQAYKSAMDVVVQQMNEKIIKLESTVADLTTSLQYSQWEIEDLKTTIKEHNKEKQATKVKMDQQVTALITSKSEIERLEERYGGLWQTQEHSYHGLGGAERKWDVGADSDAGDVPLGEQDAAIWPGAGKGP